MRTERFAVTLREEWEEQKKARKARSCRGADHEAKPQETKPLWVQKPGMGIQLTWEYQTSGFSKHPARSQSITRPIPREEPLYSLLSTIHTAHWGMKTHPVKLQERKQLSLPSLTGSFITVVGVHPGMRRNLAGHGEDSPRSEFPKTVSRAIFTTQRAGASGGSAGTGPLSHCFPG